MVFFKYFKAGTVTILASDRESQDKGTILLLHESLTDPNASSLLKGNLLVHIDLWTQEVSCKITDFEWLKSRDRWCSSDVLMLNIAYSLAAFQLLGDRISNRMVNWGSNLPTNREFVFSDLYWQWLEDVLSINDELLTKAGIYGAVLTSLFSYDRHPPIIRTFLEYWCSETNTLHTS
ncbi:hypothetical protein ACFX1Q_013987 [Malus domestica]